MNPQGLDFVGIPARDAAALTPFYRETLGLAPDDNVETDVWLDGTCFSIWEPEKFGMAFEPQRNAHLAINVEDVEAAKAELEGKGVEFMGDMFDTGVCHMALFRDPEGNDLMLHSRYAPKS